MSQLVWTDFYESGVGMEQLPLLMDWVRLQLEKVEAPSKSKMRYELVLEEAIVNVIHYAYLEGTGAIYLQCDFFSDGIMRFIIKDEGIAFDPLSFQEPQTDISLESRKEGGMGIFLIRKNCDEVLYERTSEGNVLTLKKQMNH